MQFPQKVKSQKNSAWQTQGGILPRTGKKTFEVHFVAMACASGRKT